MQSKGFFSIAKIRKRQKVKEKRQKKMKNPGAIILLLGLFKLYNEKSNFS